MIFKYRTKPVLIITVLFFLLISCSSSHRYPDVWFELVNDPNKPDWEILPEEAGPGEVILSKRNELGILSNFAATPFELDCKRYASVEGFWQMMLYPEGPMTSAQKQKMSSGNSHANKLRK